MAPAPSRPAHRSREIARRTVGVLAGLVITAYGTGAALSVAVSDAETVAGKAGDAVRAVETLDDRYQAARRIADDREDIESALTTLANAPDESELREGVARSSKTIGDIEKTAAALAAAREAVRDLSPLNAFAKAREAAGHVKEAVDARPAVRELRDLAAFAEQVGPAVGEADALIDVYYSGVQQAVDNFASDERNGTIGVMATALGLAFVLAQAVGFWARRGRPGWLARTLQGWGARRFRHWYVDNTSHAMSPQLWSAACERFQRDLVADPQEALDPDVFRDLESWFASRSSRATD